VIALSMTYSIDYRSQYLSHDRIGHQRRHFHGEQSICNGKQQIF